MEEKNNNTIQTINLKNKKVDGGKFGAYSMRQKEEIINKIHRAFKENPQGFTLNQEGQTLNLKKGFVYSITNNIRICEEVYYKGRQDYKKFFTVLRFLLSYNSKTHTNDGHKYIAS